jgi:hypothetical protein
MPKLNFSNYFLSEADNSTHVLTFMRANPITVGHERVVNQVQQLAKDFDADHSVILSHSHDGDKNPLTPEQKLRHARIAFPGVNVRTSSPEAPSLLHHVAALSQKGVKNLHLVVGQDRVEQFKNLLNKYNHVVDAPHGPIDLDNITVHSAGGRDPDAEGVEGISATDQRKKAVEGNFEGFRAGAPSRMNDNQVMDLFNNVKNGIIPKAPKKLNSKQKFNPGTPVYVQHGSHSQEPIKENIRLSFRALTEAKAKVSGLQSLLDSPKYQNAKADTVGHLEYVNDHIAKGDSDNVHDALSNHYSDNPHSEHVDYYSNESYPINMALYMHHDEGGDPKQLPDEDINDISHDDIKGLDKALKVNKTPKPMTVFSGVGFNPGQMAAKHPKGNLYMPSYTSTSISPSVASQFAKPLTTGSEQDGYNPDADKAKDGADHHMLRINLPKGHSGSYIADSSYHPEEKEFLLPRQQTMQINPKPEVHEFEHNGVTHRMHIWDATPNPTKLPKPIKEETVASGEMVRGLGDVTGNPAVQDNPLQQYFGVNALAVDKVNGALLKLMKDSQLKYNMVGFKTFNPSSRDKSLEYYEKDENHNPLLRDKIRNRNKNNNVTKG